MSKKSEELANYLRPILGEEDTEKLVRLCSNYDKYIKRYKKEVNAILEPHGHAVILAHSFVDTETRKQLKENLNGNTDETSSNT